MDMNLNKSTTE